MRKETFRYRPHYGISRRWQIHIYSLGGLYYESPEYAAMIDEAITAVAPDYYHALKRCIVNDDSPRKVSYDFFISERTIEYRLRRYYAYMYQKLNKE